jgi:hypothetical protein
MKKVLTCFGLGLLSFTAVASLYYYIFTKKTKSHLYYLIEGNERYMKKNNNLFKTSLNDVLILNLNKDLEPKKIFNINCITKNILNAEDLLSNDFEFISNIILDKNIKTVVVLDSKENDFKSKNFLTFITQDENIRKSIGKVKTYWATCDSKGYVAFHHLM